MALSFLDAFDIFSCSFWNIFRDLLRCISASLVAFEGDFSTLCSRRRDFLRSSIVRGLLNTELKSKSSSEESSSSDDRYFLAAASFKGCLSVISSSSSDESESLSLVIFVFGMELL